MKMFFLNQRENKDNTAATDDTNAKRKIKYGV